MPLFQKSVVNKYISEQDKNLVENQFDVFKKYFQNATIQKNIIASKEEEFQEGFLRELFVNVFGYTINPEPNYNLVTELKNEKDSKKADGAILKDEKAIAVIELKSTTTTDLNKIEIQAFNYKNNQKECKYVITSNFQKLRFYIDNAIEFLEWDLFKIDKENFKLLYLCLSKENLLNDLPTTIKKESLIEEENITKRLYKEYSNFRKSLFNNIVELNPNTDKLLLFKKTQKLLDRFLFLFFAEDRMLVPPNSVRLILEQWNSLKDMDAYVALYDRFKLYFGYLNTGHKGKLHEIFAYNGGLFATDEVLDNIKIDDEILYNATHSLSRYDYNSDVDVNILGHIFEHSLTEIEELENEIEQGETTTDKKASKRKKDGVFYTPKYITKYIVENTVGTLCKNKKEELSLQEEDYHTLTKKEKKKLYTTLQEYKTWLLQITIVDPACGSGAFLNQALEFLIAEHKWINELEANITGSSIVFDIENSILENNLFGVDINEESVEIAKLSLWLRTAQKGRKLNSLNNNIKCGNSLIDDVNVAGDKAFNWQNEFPKIFAKSGFDVVIGNPPYVRQELFKEIKPYLEANYTCYNSIADLYTYFIEKGIEILKNNGYFSYILPNKFIKANYGNNIRKTIVKLINVELIYDFEDYPVFEDATTYPLIFVFSKGATRKNFTYSQIDKTINADPISTLYNKQSICESESLKNDEWKLTNSLNFDVINKLISSSTCLKDIVDDKIFRGVSTGKNDVFIINEFQKNEFQKNDNIIRKIVTGKEVKRYSIDYQNQYLLFLDWEYDLEIDISIKQYLEKNKNLLDERPEVKEGRYNWWCLSRYGSKNSQYLFQPKIIYPRINSTCNFYLDEKGEMSLSDNNFFIASSSKSLLAVLNSKLIFYYLKTICPTLQGGFLDFRRPYVEKIPIHKNLLNYENKFIDKAEIMLSKNEELHKISKTFIQLLSSKLESLNINTKLEKWYSLSFADFSKELNKQKIKLSLHEESEWLQYFEQEKQKAISIKTEIDTTDKLIDKMVYELYGLTEDEIKIVEGN